MDDWSAKSKQGAALHELGRRTPSFLSKSFSEKYFPGQTVCPGCKHLWEVILEFGMPVLAARYRHNPSKLFNWAAVGRRVSKLPIRQMPMLSLFHCSRLT